MPIITIPAGKYRIAERVDKRSRRKVDANKINKQTSSYSVSSNTYKYMHVHNERKTTECARGKWHGEYMACKCRGRPKNLARRFQFGLKYRTRKSMKYLKRGEFNRN